MLLRKPAVPCISRRCCSCSNLHCSPVRPSQDRRQQLATVAAASKEGRTWGSGWGRRKGTTHNKQRPADSGILQQQHQNLQQTVQQQRQQQQQPDAQNLKQLSTEDYAAVYNAIANSIHEKLLQNEIFGCCQPASLLFYEAVKQVNPLADPRFVLGYVVIPEPSPGGPDVCARHLWVQLDGKRYDIGQSVATAMLQKRFGRKVPLPNYGLEKPPTAVYVGWDMAAMSKQLKPNVTTEAQDAALVEQFESEAGRGLYWSGSSPQLLQARTEVLSRQWLQQGQ